MNLNDLEKIERQVFNKLQAVRSVLNKGQFATEREEQRLVKREAELILAWVNARDKIEEHKNTSKS